MNSSEAQEYPQMNDIRQDYERFRSIVGDYATRILQVYPESGIERDQITRCYRSFDRFSSEFSDEQSRQRMLERVENTVALMREAYDELFVEAAEADIIFSNEQPDSEWN